jgi:hypothetical protein
MGLNPPTLCPQALKTHHRILSLVFTTGQVEPERGLSTGSDVANSNNN